jgi:hypothetical protein
MRVLRDGGLAVAVDFSMETRSGEEARTRIAADISSTTKVDKQAVFA